MQTLVQKVCSGRKMNLKTLEHHSESAIEVVKSSVPPYLLCYGLQSVTP